MTAQPHVVIGELAVSGATIRAERNSIEAWPGYGVVCYPLGTLNGNIPAIAKGLVGLCSAQEQMRRELDDPTYSVAVMLDGVEFNCQSVEVVAEQLATLYQRHNQK